MSSEQAAFLRSICENPLDDTVRLVYADWLEEHEQGERAELIRVQIRNGQSHPQCFCDDCVRNRDLTNALDSRLSAPCPAVNHSLSAQCSICGDSKNLYRSRTYTPTGHVETPRPYHFDRGCLYLDVRLGDVAERDWVCRCGVKHKSDLGICTNCMRREGEWSTQWRPTPWAAALPADVVGLWVTDREPYHNGSGYCWYDQRRERPTLIVPESAELPTPVFRSLAHRNPMGTRWKDYPTPDLAHLHLAHALRQWIYECVSRDSTAT